MRIGITYDLRDDYLRRGYGKEETAELDSEETVDAIACALGKLGHQTVNIGSLNELARRLLANERWDLVFNIAEGFHGLGREAQVPCLLDAYQIPYTFSDPVVLGLTLHKGLTKHVIRDLGLPTPDFVVVSDTEEINDLNLRYPLFAKPVGEGTSKGISSESKIDDPRQLRAVVARLLSLYRQPVLIEAFLPGREFTVGLVGTGKATRALGIMEVQLLDTAEQSSYSYQNKANYEDRVKYRLVDDETAEQAKETAVKAWRGLDCRDAGRIDLRCDANGVPQFIEVNPLAGLNPVWSDLPILARMAGVDYVELLGMIIDSACERIGEA